MDDLFLLLIYVAMVAAFFAVCIGVHDVGAFALRAYRRWQRKRRAQKLFRETFKRGGWK